MYWSFSNAHFKECVLFFRYQPRVNILPGSSKCKIIYHSKVLQIYMGSVSKSRKIATFICLKNDSFYPTYFFLWKCNASYSLSMKSHCIVHSFLSDESCHLGERVEEAVVAFGYGQSEARVEQAPVASYQKTSQYTTLF